MADDLGGYGGYFLGGWVIRSRRVADGGVACTLNVGLLHALDERGKLVAGAHEALRRIGRHDAHVVLSD